MKQFGKNSTKKQPPTNKETHQKQSMWRRRTLELQTPKQKSVKPEKQQNPTNKNMKPHQQRKRKT